MAEPICAKKGAYCVELEAGEYWWCSCGKSAKQPFCDGSHQGSEFSPVKLSLNEKSTVFLCGCKRSNNKPYCDGTHNKL